MARLLVPVLSFFAAALVLPLAAHAGTPTASAYHDLVLGPSVGADQPFFQDGTFMLGDKQIKLEQGSLPKDKMVSYDEAAGKIIVNNDKSLSDVDKGAAVLQLMDALSLQSIEPAAGQ
ncbi:MAG TPA: hypothetical protein VGF14_05865 [Alphaproteobacteria bacterium]